ncbi:MAG: HNH endonuclease [Acidimicrobiia bacterium]
MCDLREGVSAAAARDRSGWSSAARSAELLELLGVRERLDALIVQVAGAWDREQSWALDGAASPVAWLAHRAPLTRQDASVLMRTARHVGTHDKTAKALDAGDITATHAQIAARASKHREEHYPEHEDVILDAARTLDPAGFRDVMAHWRHCADAVTDHHDARDQMDGNYLDIDATFAGVGHLDGRLDPISTKALTDVLDQMEPPDPIDRPGGPRTLGQRRAAALVRLACGDAPPAVSIDILVDEDTFASRMPADLSRAVCELCGHGPISPAVVSMLACDAAIGRIVRRGEGEVLDIGRRSRLVTASQRRALSARDRGCVEPGCHAPAQWCDAHHIRHWTRHGPTDLANLELRCRRHHLLQHQRDLATVLPRRQ